MSSPRMIPRGSIGYTTVPLLVQIRLILASIVEVPSGREIWRERAAILIKEITSFHSHLSCCIHTTNGGSVGIVGRQSYARSIGCLTLQVYIYPLICILKETVIGHFFNLLSSYQGRKVLCVQYQWSIDSHR